ncbi:hypothetical protein EVC17_005 [Rhizobium phage RHph_Y1_1]|nr:hypothetical protein EVB80_005 [Rhizobium phage RHph_I36]QIG75362.1 hypothetical protein EVC17_005 [Rhizobium phage RHph_Y1_1]QIG75912.1 hypothetical protein EVC21_005 [Rhizobium phage RHph_Y2_17_2]
MSKLTIAKAEKALAEHHGVVLYAAEACGVTRQAFWKFMNKHPELKEAQAEASEVLLDIGEKHLTTAISAGDMKTIRWHLERKGKDRGYTTRQESTGKDGEPLQMGVIERRIVDPEGDEE